MQSAAFFFTLFTEGAGDIQLIPQKALNKHAAFKFVL